METIEFLRTSMFSLISFIFYHHLFSRLFVLTRTWEQQLWSQWGEMLHYWTERTVKNNSKYQLLDVQFQLK